MSGHRFAFPIMIAASMCITPAFAATESSYVYCDNGTRCFKQPCPWNSALDLSDKLHAGKIVVRGSIERRTQTITGKDYTLSWLVATRVVRAAKDSERKHCTSH